MKQIIRWVFLQVVDSYWMEHLTVLEDLRSGIGLRGYGQRDPLVEYKNEAYLMFERLMKNIDYEVADKIMRVQVRMGPMDRQQTALQAAAQQAIYQSAVGQKGISAGVPPSGSISQPAAARIKPVVSGQKKLGRNDPCWCNSGKKWKKCHYPEL